MSGYERRPVLGAHVEALAAHVLARDFGEEIEKKAERYARVGTPLSVEACRQMRRALAEMRESARLRKELQRELEDCGTAEVPETPPGAESDRSVGHGWLTAQEVAEQLGVEARTVTGWCVGAELPATRGRGRGRPWLIRPQDVADFQDRRQG